MQVYLEISPDAAGIFRFLAFWVASKGRSSGKKLHLCFWVFSFLLTAAVGDVGSVFSLLFHEFILIQDPVVLSGTPLLLHFTQTAGCPARSLVDIPNPSLYSICIFPPTAWMYMQFCAANMGASPIAPRVNR